MKNTFEQGQVKVLVYKEKNSNIWYATALEFNLTVDGEDNSAVFIELQQAIQDYLKSAREIRDESLLNQTPDPELLQMWEANLSMGSIAESSIQSPYIASFAGVEKLMHAE